MAWIVGAGLAGFIAGFVAGIFYCAAAVGEYRAQGEGK